jgi:hypothetical protein
VHLNDGTTQTVTATNIPSYVPTNGLVGYWPFNGNANDESGNGNDGTVNGASLTTDRHGNSSSAYSFDGNSNRIAFNLNSINNTFPSTSESTSSIWIKTSDLNGPLISMQGNNGIEYDFHIGTLADIVKKSGHYGILVRDNCCGTGNNGFASSCADGNWHLLTIIRLTDGTLKFYKDAVLEFTSSSGQSGSLTFNPNYMMFGANYSWIIGTQNGGCGSCNSNDEQHYKGVLDDIAIWNRALSSTEITNLYNASTNTSNSAKSKYFFITNPFTTPVKLCRIQGLNPTNVDPSFYYWKQRRNTVTNNFSPAEWQAERIFNGTALRDSNIAIPAFGTILVRLKNNNTRFTIPESAKQLTNFDYIIGGAKGTSKTGLMFLDASASDVGNNGLEIKLLVNDSQEADRVLVYNEPLQLANFTTADARKYLNQDFPNVFTLSADAKPLALDMQDIKAELDNGKPEVAIPLAVNREANKRFSTLKWKITANTTGLDVYLRNRENGSTELWSVGDIKTVSFKSDASEIRNYELVFKRNSSSSEDLTQKPNFSKHSPMELIAYPNPVEDKLHLKVINASGDIPFHIYSITGVKVMDGSLKSEKTINTAGLNAGVYVIDAGGMKVKFIKK